jgi:Skp family chaperone for outer membrane proteins
VPVKDNVMRFLARCLPVLAVAALLAAPASAQQLYKYVGPDGRVQYTDRPPGGGQKVEKVTGSRVSTVGSSAAPASTAEGAAKSGAPKTSAEQEQAFRQRRAEAEEKAKKEEKLAQESRGKQEQCDAMRRQLAGMQAGGRIVRPNEQGERVFLEDDQIQSEIARLQRELAANCR